MRRMVVGIALFVSTAVVCGASSSRADNMMAAQPPASFQTEKATKCEDPNPTVGKVNRIVMSSGLNLTKGSERGFPRGYGRANLRDAPRYRR
jgi:hypothetical protein